ASDRDGSWAIWLREEGAAERRVSGPGADALGPSWASDSRRLAYFRRGTRTDSFEIWVVDVESGKGESIGPGLVPALWASGAGRGVDRLPGGAPAGRRLVLDLEGAARWQPADRAGAQRGVGRGAPQLVARWPVDRVRRRRQGAPAGRRGHRPRPDRWRHLPD